MKKAKKIIILGSSGSIGDSALKVVRSFKNEFEVVGLTVDSNIKKLTEQIKMFKPKAVGIVNPKVYEDFMYSPVYRARAKGFKVYGGVPALEKIATMPGADMVLSGVVGGVGLKALLAALKMGRTVALANKESLIMAGELVLRTAKKSGAQLLPVDSEHSAMFQCLLGQDRASVHKIILTASGGPFYKYEGHLSEVTVQKALAHPNWVMGKKITVDSATLMNKGLEAIEAHFLFGVPLDKIQIVIHPQSIIHSAIEYADGAILAQLSQPDMCLPIQYAMTYPERKPCPMKRLDLTELGRMDFFRPDFRKFPCLELAIAAGKAGGTMPTVLSAANEIAVYAFLQEKILFTDIPKIVERTLKRHSSIQNPSLDSILDADLWARQIARESISKMRVRENVSGV